MNAFLRAPSGHAVFRGLFLLMSLVMTGLAIQTSLESNLFQEGAALLRIPWMRATLWDFYFNIGIISFWMFYKERNAARGFFWLLLFVCLGSIATAFYVFLQLRRVHSPAPVTDVFFYSK